MFGRNVSEAAKIYSREKKLLKTNLANLIKEVTLIEKNKFPDQLKNAIEDLDPTEQFFGEEITESIQNESGVHAVNWGPIRNNINFINSKPALAPEINTKATHDDIDNISFDSQKVDEESKSTGKEQILSELEIALMVKHSDPLKYYSMK